MDKYWGKDNEVNIRITALHLTPSTDEKGDSQGKIISFGLRGIPKNTEISFGKIHDYRTG